jgi:putative hemolysin
MTPASSILMIFCSAVVETLASYISRVYSRVRQDPHPRNCRKTSTPGRSWSSRSSASAANTPPSPPQSCNNWSWASSPWSSARFSSIALLRWSGPPYAEIAQAVLGVVLVIVFCNQLLPTLLFNRTRGRWAGTSGLAHPPAAVADDSHHRLCPLLLLRGRAGRGAGHRRRGDRRRCRGAAGGRRRRGHSGRERPRTGPLRRRVRRQAGPRGDDAAPGGLCRLRPITLEQFLELDCASTTTPASRSTKARIDNITGIAFAHDLLQIADDRGPYPHRGQHGSARRSFVPETKRGYELLREMQREKQHMRIVIDEYGGVSGLVTIEDLLEADRRRNPRRARGRGTHRRPQREPHGVWLVPGSFPVDQLPDLFGEQAGLSDLDEAYEATTLGGLVSEVEGRIPLPGEVVLLESAGLRIEVVASTDRRVERLRVFPPAGEESAQ